MLDNFNREINYLRISVTDRCNLRCVYCMPAEGIPTKSHDDMLTYEQVVTIVEEAVKLGIHKVRLTGGEPLVRKNIDRLIYMLSNIHGIKHLALTTNGILLAQQAANLKQLGLNSINISLDTLIPEKYKTITRGGNISDVMKGIHAALAEGFSIKINMVVIKNINDDEIVDMKTFCQNNKIELQLINHFSLSSEKKDSYEFDRPPKCESCNRIRLLSDGFFKPCLHSEILYKVDFSDIKGSLEKTILAKPQKGSVCTLKQMVEIGG